MAKGKKTGGGSRKGVPNRATADVRAAIALVLGHNVEKFEKWLNLVAEGRREFEPKLDADGNEIKDSQGKPKGKWIWMYRPDPGYALKLAIDMAEYHIPKQARTELSGPDGKALNFSLSVPPKAE